MARPTVSDDGSTVTLDLHGATVNEAMQLIYAAVREANARGRSSLRIIHGSSTSDARTGNRTIKHELLAELDGGSLSRLITGTVRLENETLLSLPIGVSGHRGRISMLDLV